MSTGADDYTEDQLDPPWIADLAFDPNVTFYEREILMKPNSDARALLRHTFNTDLESCRHARRESNQLLGQGRAEGNMNLINAAVAKRLSGSRELCLALAFCNNTTYLAAEANGKAMKGAEKPSKTALDTLLAPCFPGVSRAALAGYIESWLTRGDATPKQLFPQPPVDERATRETAPPAELLSACT